MYTKVADQYVAKDDFVDTECAYVPTSFIFYFSS